MIDFWIITVHELFHKVIVENDLPINEMTAVQLTTLIDEQEDDTIIMDEELKSSLIDAALKEIGPTTARLCNVPSKNELMRSSLDQPLQWDPVESFCKNPLQS